MNGLSSAAPAANAAPAQAAPPAPRDRRALVDELARLYGAGPGARQLMYWRKRLAWSLVIGGATAVKRGLDVLGALVGLVLFSPVLALIALCIKLTDGGPILYVAPRVGKWGREFPFPKFRSMVLNADRLKDQLLDQNEHGQGVTFKMKRDPRVTWVGRFIRRASIDELPQLWSVLVGDMSLVGPRPPVPREVALYTLADRRRLEVTPGITCIWQVSGRSNIPFPRQVELDVEYIRSQSLWTDLALLFRTVPAVLLGHGAY